MREILEDAAGHSDDGFGRTDRANALQLRKRFYEQASFVAQDGSYIVQLDGRSVKTPSGEIVSLPREVIAQKVVQEWAAQDEFIDPRTMPFVRLVNAAIEGGADAAQALRDEVIKYAGNDMLLFRAESPAELVARQDALWDSILVKVAREFGVTFQPVVGIVHQDQPPRTLEKLASLLVDLDHFSLTALMSITNLTGSGILAIALKFQLVSADEVWAAAHLEEDFNISMWGEDGEAVKRRDARRIEFDVAHFLLQND